MIVAPLPATRVRFPAFSVAEPLLACTVSSELPELRAMLPTVCKPAVPLRALNSSAPPLSVIVAAVFKRLRAWMPLSSNRRTDRLIVKELMLGSAPWFDQIRQAP